MWLNIYNFVDASLKYILIFNDYQSTQDGKFLVFDSLTDTKMPGLWNEGGAVKAESSNICDKDEYNLIVEKAEEKVLVHGDNVWNCHSHILNIKGIAYNTCQDVVNRNRNVKFEVISIPFSMSLYKKIMTLSERNVVIFNIDEICQILLNLKMFSVCRQGLLALTVCMYINNDSHLLLIPTSCSKEITAQYSFPIQLISSFLFGMGDKAVYFRKIVKSHVFFTLYDDNDLESRLHGALIGPNSYTRRVHLKTFFLIFLFDKLVTNDIWLQANEHILTEKFENTNINLRYKIILTEDYTCENEFDENRILQRNLATLSASNFLTGSYIDEISIYLGNVRSKIFFPDISRIMAQITINCKTSSFDFIRSVPENVQVVVEISRDSSITSLCLIPANVVRISLYDEKLCGNMVIPTHIKNVSIYNCIVNKNAAITLSKESNRVSISYTQAKVLLSGIAGFNEIETSMASFCFEYDENENSGQKTLWLNSVQINETVTIDPDIQELTFKRVRLSQENRVILKEKSSRLSISETEGLFDLTSYLGITYNFSCYMAMDVSPIYSSDHSLSQIKLFKFHFDETARFADIYKRVELNRVSMKSGSMIVLNRACKELVITECAVVINAVQIEQLDSLTLEFSLMYARETKVLGLKSVKRLCIVNMCQKMDWIVTMLTSMSIEHLEFRSDYSNENEETIVQYYNELMTAISQGGCLENNKLALKINDLATLTGPSFPFVYGITEFLVMHLLKAVLNEEEIISISNSEPAHSTDDIADSMMTRRLSSVETLEIPLMDCDHVFNNKVLNGVKLLKLSKPPARSVNRMYKQDLTCPNIIQPCESIKILIIDAEFLCILPGIALLMPSLECLQICNLIYWASSPNFEQCQNVKYNLDPSHRYQSFSNMRLKAVNAGSKLKLRKLILECHEYLADACRTKINQPDIVALIDNLKIHIDFESLNSFTIVSPAHLILIDPRTLQTTY